MSTRAAPPCGLLNGVARGDPDARLRSADSLATARSSHALRTVVKKTPASDES